MRIITGKARGVRLAPLSGDATRPTSERAKEAVFSMLQFQISGAVVLDLFAGSGQMGLEALSRGAGKAVLCDLSREAVAVIKTNIEKTRLSEGCEVICADYQSAILRLSGKECFDMVFIDPPYAKGYVPNALSMLVRHGLLADGAKLICETAAEQDVFGEDESLSNFLEIIKQVRYGAAVITVLQFQKGEASV